MYDLVVRDCRIVKTDAIVNGTICVSSGHIVALLAPGEQAKGHRELNADGRYVLPGLIDTHVHFGNAGNSFDQDCRTESRAAATGGVTTLMVFNLPQSLVGEKTPVGFSFDDILPDRIRSVQGNSLVDVVFHLGILDRSLIHHIPHYAEKYGVRSFKAFMRGTSALNDGYLLQFFEQVARVPGGIALVHCENDAIVALKEPLLRASGRQDLAAWAERSPVFAELESIHRAITLADAAGVSRMVVVHMGIGNGSGFLAQKRWGSVSVATETCPHYLVFDRDQALGVAGKVGPPLKSRADVEALWDRLRDGTVDFMGSDQLAYTWATKGSDLWAAPSGITGGMAMILPVLLTDGVMKARLSFPRVVELTSTNAAKLFGLYPRKGALEIGSDADFVIVDEDRVVTVEPAVLNSFSDYTPYKGYRTHGWVATTIASGRVIYDDGVVVDDGGRGRLIAVGDGG